LIALFIAGILVHVVIPEIIGVQIWDYHLLSLFHAQFLVGVVIFMLQDRIAAFNYRVLILAALLSFVGVCGIYQYFFGMKALGEPDAAGFAGIMRVLGFGLASAFLISGLIAAERQGSFSRGAVLWSACVSALVLIGNASYGLYLSHSITYGVIGKLYGMVGVPNLLLFPALAMAVLSAVLVAVLWHLLVEQPFLKWIHTPSNRLGPEYAVSILSSGRGADWARWKKGWHPLHRVRP
jgi:exopolysaccharide production protein ExoZ